MFLGLDTKTSIDLNSHGNSNGPFKVKRYAYTHAHPLLTKPRGTDPLQRLYMFIGDIVYQAQTINLFTCDVLIPMIIPWTATGVVDALYGGVFLSESVRDPLAIVQRIPYAFFWLWINTLAFAINNQMCSHSITEDTINKPWRALPSGRISNTQARNLLLGLVPVVYAITTYLGAGNTTLMALILNWMYNDLGGSDVHYTVRNLINALAMVVASIGTTQVSVHTGFSNQSPVITFHGCQWIAIKAAIIFTTLQVQDLRDQEGDQSRLRSTVPIMLGDEFARWSVAVPILLWSLLTPYFWATNLGGFVWPVILGLVMCIRVLFLRNVDADRMTWRLWGLWTMSIFLLPVYKRFEGIMAL